VLFRSQQQQQQKLPLIKID
jgi:hypothetical protein